MSLRIEDQNAAFQDIRSPLSCDSTLLVSRIHEGAIKRLISMENGRTLQSLSWDLDTIGVSCLRLSLLRMANYRSRRSATDSFLSGATQGKVNKSEVNILEGSLQMYNLEISLLLLDAVKLLGLSTLSEPS